MKPENTWKVPCAHRLLSVGSLVNPAERPKNPGVWELGFRRRGKCRKQRENSSSQWRWSDQPTDRWHYVLFNNESYPLTSPHGPALDLAPALLKVGNFASMQVLYLYSLIP